MVDNNHPWSCLCSSLSMPLIKNGHVPSYVGISCAISGYTNYSKYCSSSMRSNTNSLISKTSTPSSPLIHSPLQTEPVTFPVMNVNVDESRELNHSLSSESDYKAQYNKVQRSYGAQVMDMSGSRDYAHEGVGEYDEMDSSVTDASIVQKRIASLYGATFASTWKQSRSKLKPFNISATPKCDVMSDAGEDVIDTSLLKRIKSPPVFRLLTKDFLGQLETANEETSITSMSREQQEQQETQHSTHSHLIESSSPSMKVEIPCASTESNVMTRHETSSTCTTSSTSVTTTSLSSSSSSTTTSNKTCTSSSPSSSMSMQKDGNWYLSELNKTTEEIKERVTETEKILEEETELGVSEEISGKLRSAIGKANLLMSKKLNQFRELCMKNIEANSEEQFETTNEDLAGFWDMVYIQVIDVKETFEEIKENKKNNWENIDKQLQPKTSTPTKSRSQAHTRRQFASPSKGSPKSSPCKSSSDKSSSDDSSSREVERKNKLKEAKRRQAELMAAKCDDNKTDITIFTPPNHKE